MIRTARIPPVATPRARLPHRHPTAVQRLHGRAAFLKGILTVVLMLAVTPIAHADVFTVHTNAELDSANHHVRPGDVVLLADGTFDLRRIAPDSAGTAGARITYVGNLANPGNVVVAQGIQPTSHLTVKGVATGAIAPVRYAGVHHDSLLSCIVGDELHLDNACFSVFEDLDVLGRAFTVAQGTDSGNAEGNTIGSCRFPNLRSKPNVNAWAWGTGMTSADAALRKRVVSCDFRFNHFVIDVSGSRPKPPAKHFQTQSCLFYGNRTDIAGVVDTLGDETHWILWRDSSCCNVFRRDTIIIDNQNSRVGIAPFYSGSGTVPGGNSNISIDSCYFKVFRAGPLGNPGVIYAQEPMPGLSITNSQILVHEGVPLIYTAPLNDGLVVRHNTFFTADRQAWRDGCESGWQAPARMTGNLFFARTIPPACLDSTAVMKETHTATPGDSSYYFRAAGSPSTALYGSSGCQVIAEPHSRWADPVFADTAWATLDLTPTTAAMGDSCMNWPGGYAGALAYRQPPRAVTDATCEVGRKTVAVRWTTPCHLEPTPAHFELRYALTPITDLQQFQAAPLGASGTAEAPGIAQCGLVAQLQPCTRYYFAVVLNNDYGSAPVSNSLYATLKCTGFEVECDAQRRPVRTAAEPAHPGLPSPLSASAAQPVSLWLGAGAEDAGRPYGVELFDVAGRREAVLAAGVLAAGQTSVRLAQGLAGRGLRPGVHFLRVRIGERKLVRTVVLTP